MTLKLKHVGLAMLAASMVVTFAACGPNNNNSPGSGSSSGGATSMFTKDLSGTMKSYGYNPSDEVGKSRSDYATAQLKKDGVTVTLDTSNFDTQKFAAQAAAGQVPDLIQPDRNAIVTLADKGLIVPLDQCYALYGVNPTQRFYQSTIDDMTYEGHIYGIPQFFQPTALIVNKRVMKKAGVSLSQIDTSKPDEMLAITKKMYKANGGKPAVLGFDPNVPGDIAVWFAVFGGKLNDSTGKPTLDDPNNVKALTWLKQIMDAQGGYPKVKSFEDAEDVFGNDNAYVKDQVGVQDWAQWYVNVLSNTKDKVSIAGVPIKTLEGKPLAMAGGSALAIPKAAKNKSAACAWAIDVTSPEAWKLAGQARAKTVQQKNSINTGLFTGSPVADQEVRKDFVKPSGNADFDQVIDTYYKILPDNQTQGASAVGSSISNDVNNAVIVALSGGKTPQAALQEAQASSMRAWQQSNAGKKG